ncbi:MAG: hypothetical protein JW795_21885 [Chitinivibrionales bacterium]|nr:hypothetical protein [Chitinivibrionales bacterium]
MIVMQKCLLLIIAIVGCAVAQKITISECLRSVAENPLVKIQDEKIRFLTKSSADAPCIDDAQFGIRNEAFLLNRNRYSIRFDPAGLGETGAKRQLNKKSIVSSETRKRFLINMVLKSRYIKILEFLSQKNILQLNHELLAVYEDKIKVLKKTSGTVKFDMADLLDVEDKFTKLNYETIEMEKRSESLLGQIRTFTKTKFDEIDTTGFISIQMVDSIISSGGLHIDTNNVYLADLRAQYRQAESRYALEKSEGRRFIRAIEFSYDHGQYLDELADKNDPKGKEYDLNKAFLLSFDFQLPFIGVNQADRDRRQLSFLSAREDYVQTRFELDTQMVKDMDDIKISVAQYAFLDSRESDVNSQASLKRYLKMDGIDPIILLSIKESILENSVNKEESRFNIIYNYLKVIDYAGKLTEPPLRNYLLKSRELIGHE